MVTNHNGLWWYVAAIKVMTLLEKCVLKIQMCSKPLFALHPRSSVFLILGGGGGGIERGIERGMESHLS